MKGIYEFKKGDTITRIIPSKSKGQTITQSGQVINNIDRSYMGDKLIFIGIANGQIYFKVDNDLHKQLFGDVLSNIPLDIFDCGWDYYTDPNSLFDGFEILDRDNLTLQYNAAIRDENYELAKILKDKLDKI